MPTTLPSVPANPAVGERASDPGHYLYLATSAARLDYGSTNAFFDSLRPVALNAWRNRNVVFRRLPAAQKLRPLRLRGRKRRIANAVYV